MGLFFSNLHIQSTSGLEVSLVSSLLVEILRNQGFQTKYDPEGADLSLSIYYAGGKWISVCSDGLDFYTEESVRNICNRISERLSTKVLTVACFDSDCLILNCIDRSNNVDAFAKVGYYPGIRRRYTPAKWKGLVNNYEIWESILNQDYTFAEEALDDIEPLLELEPKQGQFCDELISDLYAEKTNTIYFALPESASKSKLPKLSFTTPSLEPYGIGKDQFYFVINTGGKNNRVAVGFSGSYVEKEDIPFRDVQLEYALDHFPRKTVLLQLEKRQTQSGQWIYYAELPDFPIREGVKEGLPWKRKSDEEWERQFDVRLTPEGNPRKLLDITVHFIPLNNPEGQCRWCVWLYSGSK